MAISSGNLELHTMAPHRNPMSIPKQSIQGGYIETLNNRMNAVQMPGLSSHFFSGNHFQFF